MTLPILPKTPRSTSPLQEGAARRRYVHKWLNRVRGRLGAWGLGGWGLGSLLTLLPVLARASTSQEGSFQRLESLADVQSAQVLGNGEVSLTLTNGQTVVVGAQDVRILDTGNVLISQAAAQEIAELVELAAVGGGGGGGGTGMSGLGALAGGLGAAGVAAGAGGGGGDSAAPAPPTLNLAAVQSAGITSTSTNVAAHADATSVVVTIGSLTKTVTPASDGSWSVSLTQAEAAALPQGVVTMTISSRDADDNELSSDSVTYTIDTQPPTLTISPLSIGAVLNAAEQGSDLTVSGTTTAEDGRTVTVTLNGQSYTGTVSGGNWSVTVPAAGLGALTDGANVTLTADVSDAAGNPATQASASFDVDVSAPTVTLNPIAGGSIELIDQRSDLTISGTTSAEDGRTVTVTFNGQDYTGTAAGGNWSVTVPQADLNGLSTGTPVAVSVAVSDAAGNPAAPATASVPVDLTGPSITISALPVGTDLNAVEATSDMTVSGTTSNVPDGRTVTVTLNGKTYTGTTSGGNWSVTVPAADLGALADGATVTLTADVSDSDGIAATQASTSLTTDFTPPTLAISPLSIGAVLNATEQGSDLTVTGTTTAEDGRTVTVTLNGQSYTGTTSGGSWSVTVPAAGLGALSDGATVTLTADVSDAADNPATQASASFDVDVTAPAVAITTLSDGAVMNAAERGTDLTVSGTSDAPDGTRVSVSLVRANGTVDATGTATVSGGSWTLAVPAADLNALVDGQTYTVTASVADAAGNTGTSTASFATDFSAPTVTINTLPVGAAMDAAERAADMTVTGTTTAEDGQTVTVALNGQSYTATASGGAWSVTIPSADLGALTDTTNFTLTADVSDAGGNPAAQASSIFTTDFRPVLSINDVGSNDALSLTEAQASGLTVSGNSYGMSAGQSVNVTLNGTSVGTATVAANGSWTLNVAASSFSGLTAGTDLNFQASATLGGGRDPLPVSDVVVAYVPAAYVITETGRSGSTVTFSMFADPGRDVSGGLAVTASMAFDPSVVTFNAGSADANNAFTLFLANPVGSSTVNFAGAATSFSDLSAPLATFQMTVQDASKPIVLNVTTSDGGPSTLRFGTEGADTLSATGVSNVIRGDGGDDSIDVSSGGRHVVVFEADPSANGTDTITGFTLGPAAQITDAIAFSGLDVSSLRGAGTGVETLASGGTIGTDTGVVAFTTAVSDLNASTLADAAETLVGTNAGDVFYFMASDGTNAALARVTFSDADTATAEVMGTFNGLGNLSAFHADNILHTDPTGASA